MVPTSHKASVFDPSTHASAGSYTPLAPLRRGGPQDGAFASLRSFDQRQADLQRLSDQNVASANDLRVSSPETSRSFFDEEEAETLIPARGSVTFATNPEDSLNTTSLPNRYTTPSPQADDTAVRGSEAAAITKGLDNMARLLTETMIQNEAFKTDIYRAIVTQGVGAAGAVPKVVDVASTGTDEASLASHGQSRRPKKSHGPQQMASGKAKSKKPRVKKKVSLWYGVVAGQAGSLHRSEAEARVGAREFTPRGRVSAAFRTKEAAQDWIAQNLDDPHSSDTEGGTTDDSSTDDQVEAVPTRARSLSNVVPPPPVEAAAFEFVTRDTSIGTKNEMFGIGMKQEVELFKALCPKGSSDATMKALTECIVDGTALPGKYSGTYVALLEEEGKESANTRLAESFSHALSRLTGSNILTGLDQQCDTGYKADKRISLKYVKTAEDLHDLDRDLSHAISRALENMDLAFGSALASFCWTKEQLDRHFMGGLLPFIGITTMRLYADLVRELASRVATGWERVKLDVKYFFEQLKQLRTNSPSRLRCMCRTYVFLRDQKAAKYATLDRYQAHFTGPLPGAFHGALPSPGCLQFREWRGRSMRPLQAAGPPPGRSQFMPFRKCI
jgi:hypothetical protein